MTTTTYARGGEAGLDGLAYRTPDAVVGIAWMLREQWFDAPAHRQLAERLLVRGDRHDRHAGPEPRIARAVVPEWVQATMAATSSSTAACHAAPLTAAVIRRSGASAETSCTPRPAPQLT